MKTNSFLPCYQRILIIAFSLFFTFPVLADEYLKVGDRVTLYFPYEITSKTLAGQPACTSTRPYDVQIVSLTYSSVTIEALKSFSGSPCLINVRYYYREMYNGYIYQRTGSYDFRVHVSALDPTGVTISPTSMEFNGFTQCNVYATLIPSNAQTTFTWRSTNTDVATVSANGSSGTIFAKKSGTCNIIVTTANGYSASCKVTVPSYEPTNISLPSTLSLLVGESKVLTPTISPSNATKNLTWQSSNPSVATVSSSGTITAVGVGTMIITVKTHNGLSANCNVTIIPQPIETVIRDSYAYPERSLATGTYSLTNEWLYSNYEGNFANNMPAAANASRAAVVKDGIWYFIARTATGGELVRIDVATGAKLEPIAITGEHVFEREVEKDGAMVWETAVWLPYNDLKTDAAGNLLVGGVTTTDAFQLYKVDPETGAATEIINEILRENEDIAALDDFRLDCFGVYGDVDGDAVIISASQRQFLAFKWVISGGVAGPAQIINFDFTGLTADDSYLFYNGALIANPGNAPQVLILEANAESSLFYFDGNATFPTLFSENEGTATLLDDFKTAEVGIKICNNEGDTCTLNNGHNGVITFELNGEHFLLIAATNTVGTPNSAFALYKFADANKELKDITPMWYFPSKGMGIASNAHRTAPVSVEVAEDGQSAKLCVYTGENGYGVYTLTTSTISSTLDNTKDNKISSVHKIFENGTIHILRNGDKYTTDGRKIM